MVFVKILRDLTVRLAQDDGSMVQGSMVQGKSQRDKLMVQGFEVSMRPYSQTGQRREEFKGTWYSQVIDEEQAGVLQWVQGSLYTWEDNKQETQ
jgi:hypothetical protein